MVTGHGRRLWLWQVVVVVVALRSGVEAQEYANQTFPVKPIANLLSYEQMIQQAAYATFMSRNPDTGTSYGTSLSGELANATIQAVRLRVGSLRRYGVTLGRFTIPPGLRLTNVSSVRVILVYKDFGNVSVYSSTVPGQVFVSSLAGIRVYNGDMMSSTSPLPALSAIALENPIQVIIPPNAKPSYCVEFSGNGTALATNTKAGNGSSSSSPTYACFSRTLGDNYFALVGLPLPGKKSKTWKIVLGTVLGILGLLLLASLLCCCCCRQLRKRKYKNMEARADKGPTLHPTKVGNTRAPVAPASRTGPRLERDFIVT